MAFFDWPKKNITHPQRRPLLRPQTDQAVGAHNFHAIGLVSTYRWTKCISLFNTYRLIQNVLVSTIPIDWSKCIGVVNTYRLILVSSIPIDWSNKKCIGLDNTYRLVRSRQYLSIDPKKFLTNTYRLTQRKV